MRQFHTVVLERMERLKGVLSTEPYEAGWADEAMLFVTVTGLSGTPATVAGSVQISVDGIDWIDEGSVLGPFDHDGTRCVRVRHFGGWLRAVFVLEGDGEPELTVQLALKG